ncbi:hypothetical protein [Marinobacterium jannaschii]|uniref:hypothetical protein n=1 Tax=Marinobacterium jannaschii TaxID=64970 RepID=UPI00056D607D|nr:hypothetical protein [Marinobacterium jannaschii]
MSEWRRVAVAEGHHRNRSGIDISVDIGEINQQLTVGLQDLRAQVEKAIGRAITKVGRWLRTHSVREIGRVLQIKQSVLRRRFRFHETGKGSAKQLSIWVGLLTVAAHDAGRAVQNAAGVAVRGRQFDSAFIQRIYSSDERVFIRASRNRKLQHATAGGRDSWKYRPKSPSFLAQYGDRFPVQVVGVEIESVARPILERYEQRVNARYREILEQELEYAIKHET